MGFGGCRTRLEGEVDRPSIFARLGGYVYGLGSFYEHGGAVCCWSADSFQFVGRDKVNLHSDCNSRRESSDVQGGARVLRERRRFAVGKPQRGRLRLGLRPWDGVFRRVRRRGGAAGASTCPSRWIASLETSSRATTLERVSLVVHCGAGVLLEHRQHAV